MLPKFAGEIAGFANSADMSSEDKKKFHFESKASSTMAGPWMRPMLGFDVYIASSARWSRAAEASGGKSFLKPRAPQCYIPTSRWTNHREPLAGGPSETGRSGSTGENYFQFDSDM